MRMFFMFFVIALGSAEAQVVVHKNIFYGDKQNPLYDDNFCQKNTLDIYKPVSYSTQKFPIVFFVHGGKWKIGDKKRYRFLGKKFAKQGVMTIVINYRLWTQTKSINTMIADCANAYKWVSDSISYYAGDTSKLFIMAHSSGTHLAASMYLNDSYHHTNSSFARAKGFVFFDPFGLSIETFFRKYATKKDGWMKEIFTTDSSSWHSLSPENYVTTSTPAVLMVLGGNSNIRFKCDAKHFATALNSKGVATEVKHDYPVGHIAVLFQLHHGQHPHYKTIVEFMNKVN